ncbi:hypothetical protein K440DRAFT_665349 [Wilcoxina mikolae CBS 423.85]|nr:hypothetical protein K440DRAFT_665349 [Wilcoxina mikolae CBS 423.85]
MVFLHGDYFLQLGYGTSIAQQLEKRSTNGNGGLTGGEIGGLVVGIIGIFLTALTVYISWKWRSGRNEESSPATSVTNNHITTNFNNHFHTSSGVPVQGINLDTIHHSSLPSAYRHSVPSSPQLLRPLSSVSASPNPSQRQSPIQIDQGANGHVNADSAAHSATTG